MREVFFDSKNFSNPLFRDWASRIRSQYDKHFKDQEIRDAALDAVMDTLQKLEKIPENSMAYVEKNFYNQFFERYKLLNVYLTHQKTNIYHYKIIN